MILNILTLFPLVFQNFLAESIPFIAQQKKKLFVNLVNFREFSTSKHLQVDDYPYGGGAGMVIKAEPLANALDHILDMRERIPILYFTPQGRLLNQKIVRQYLSIPELIIICGHYKEIDQRIRDKYVTEEISIGDYVLSGGELPAMVFIDAIARLLDGVLHDEESAQTDSHETNMLGYPCYTRPAEFQGMTVPEVLISGHHQKIVEWRQQKSLEITRRVRPDLIK